MAVQISIQQKLQDIRASLAAQGVDACLIPYADAYLSKNAPAPGGDRLFWATGFDSSAGTAVITKTRAALVVDPRYTLKAKAVMDPTLFNVVEDDGDAPPEAWVASALHHKGRVGYDPRFYTLADVRAMEKRLAKAGSVTLVPQPSPVDAVRGKPPIPERHAVPHDIKYCGETTASKLVRVSALLRESGVDATVITRADALSWLLNARVPALAVVPVVHGYGILNAQDQSLDVYTDVLFDPAKFATGFGDSVHIHPEKDWYKGLKAIKDAGLKIGVDDHNAPYAFRNILESWGAEVTHAPDPCTWPKAQKNASEQEGVRASHIRDALALVRLLAWVDDNSGQGIITEMDIAAKAQELRGQNDLYLGHSFASIVGFNANGASIHSLLSEDTNQTIIGDGLILFDSGGQYWDGTTDITRTLVVGTPTRDMRAAFTRVLQGHIALASAVFPAGLTGAQLDVLARAPLWKAGMDYAHGTGHGVGYCLNVHEGPCGFSPKASRGGGEALRAGLLMSIEPGYYREGAFGIRLENLVLVVGADGHNETGKDLLRFDPVTLVPFDTRAVNVDWLTAAEKDWLNAYHVRVRTTLLPLVDDRVGAWLTARTQPV